MASRKADNLDGWVNQVLEIMEGMPDVTVCSCNCHVRSDRNVRQYARALRDIYALGSKNERDRAIRIIKETPIGGANGR